MSYYTRVNCPNCQTVLMHCTCGHAKSFMEAMNCEHEWGDTVQSEYEPDHSYQKCPKCSAHRTVIQ